MNKTYAVNGKITDASGFGFFNNLMINGATYTAILNLSGDDSILTSFNGNINYSITLVSVKAKGFDVTDKVLAMSNGVSNYAGTTTITGQINSEKIYRNHYTASYQFTIGLSWNNIAGNVVIDGNGTSISSEATAIVST